MSRGEMWEGFEMRRPPSPEEKAARERLRTPLVVTRHQGLVEYICNLWEYDPRDLQVIAHATEDDVRGRVVFGVLPLRLAAAAREVIEVPLDIPPDLRGVELTLEQVEQYAGAPRIYSVECLGEVEFE